MQNMKIRIHSEEHSREVQEKLFEMGYEWTSTAKWVQNTKEPFLFAYSGGNITHDCSEGHFEKHDNPEYVLHGGYFTRPEDIVPVANIPTERPPLGLRPKYICDALRIKEILEACTRYTEVGKKIPSEWLDELTELNYQVEN